MTDEQIELILSLLEAYAYDGDSATIENLKAQLRETALITPPKSPRG
jgi:hypothetical protein